MSAAPAEQSRFPTAEKRFQFGQSLQAGLGKQEQYLAFLLFPEAASISIYLHSHPVQTA